MVQDFFHQQYDVQDSSHFHSTFDEVQVVMLTVKAMAEVVFWQMKITGWLGAGRIVFGGRGALGGSTSLVHQVVVLTS